jgi:CheY-like chemotaxis protein
MSHILIADDEPDLLEVCTTVLEASGHSVHAVTDGREVLEAARTRAPDLLVVDWVMPNLDGASAIAALRADPRTAKIPAIMMSGSVDAEAKADEVGADAFLAKPFDARELMRQVDTVLGRH